MNKRTESESKGRKGATKKGGQKAKAQAGSKARPPKAKGKSHRKRPSRRGDTQKARERAKGLIDPNVHVVTKDELRIQILSVAIQRPYAPSEFARDVDIALNVASYHFKVLRDHGFLELVDTVKVRGSFKHMYRATKSGFISDTDWGEVAAVLRPGVAGAILQDFNGCVTRAMKTGHFFDRDDACLYWAPRDLDEIAWREQVEINKWYIEASENLEVETVERRAKGESEGSIHATVAVATFPTPTHSEFKEHEAKGKAKQKAKQKARPPKPKPKLKPEAQARPKERAAANRPKAKVRPRAKGRSHECVAWAGGGSR